MAVALLIGAALALLPAGAGAVNSITLRLGDGFAVRQTHLLCAVQISKTLVPGQKLVACYFWGPSGPVPKTYSVALAVNGEAALGQVGANGKLRLVTTRGRAAAVPPQRDQTRKGTLRQVGVGTALLVKGTAITCAVAAKKFAGKATKTVACFKVNGQQKPRPNSYGIGITDGGAFLVHFDAKSKGSPVKIVQHGR
jgi:hypothetical protein